jgi:hypothetical protein
MKTKEDDGQPQAFSVAEQSGDQSDAEKIKKAILKLQQFFVVNPQQKSEVDTHVRVSEDRQRNTSSFQSIRNNHGLKTRVKQET